MKRHFTIRAKEFIKKLTPYIENQHDGYSIRAGVEEYNRTYGTNIRVSNGATRTVVICSDYVIKFDTGDTSSWGGNRSEYHAYLEAKKNNFDRWFAEMHKMLVDGHYYYIMQRASKTSAYISKPNLLNSICNADIDAYYWIIDNIADLHKGNYGMYKGKVICIDYACKRIHW